MKLKTPTHPIAIVVDDLHEPLFDVLKGLRTSDIVHDNYAICATIVGCFSKMT